MKFQCIIKSHEGNYMSTVGLPPLPIVLLLWFELQSTAVPKFKMENSRNKQFTRFKYCIILSSWMSSPALLLSP